MHLFMATMITDSISHFKDFLRTISVIWILLSDFFLFYPFPLHFRPSAFVVTFVRVPIHCCRLCRLPLWLFSQFLFRRRHIDAVYIIPLDTFVTVFTFPTSAVSVLFTGFFLSLFVPFVTVPPYISSLWSNLYWWCFSQTFTRFL